MQGVVSLLDQAHQARVEGLQAAIDQAVGVPGLCRTPIAHFSYHVAERYEADRLAAVLLSIAASHTRFVVRTSGLGLFTGERPILYIPVVRDQVLTSLHHVIWRQLSRGCVMPSAHYDPEVWLPHITIADGPALGPRLQDVIDVLKGVDLSWEIEITNVALLYGDGEALEVELWHELLAARV